ncbi:MAG: hypothetical protein ACK4ND_01455 [Cytophagaceae bacterium]
MKKFVLLFLMSLSVSAYAQKALKSVPKEVSESFSVNYPDVVVEKWFFKRKNKQYVAKFQINDFDYQAYFTDAGIWTKTERTIKRSDAPQDVWFSFRRCDYASWEVFAVKEYQTPRYEFLYVVDVIRQGYQDVSLYFLPDGTFLGTKLFY